jgi:hypothetical protein
MALNETKKKNLEDKEFDDLFNDPEQKVKWSELATNAYEYAKKNITQGSEPRLDDISGVLYPIVAADEVFRAHQDKVQARAKRWIEWFTEYIVDRVIGEGRKNTQ